jgi:hypothetical protein
MTRDRARQFTIGSPVRCSDGPCGQLRRVVIEPVDRILTHLIVKSHYRGKASRLVPLDEVKSLTRALDEIVLYCSLAEFETFERALEMHFLAGASGHWGYRQEQMLTWPHYRLGLGAGPAWVADETPNMSAETAESATATATRTFTRDRVSLSGFQVRRGDRVQATDGPAGRVQGLVVDRIDHRVTHVLLDESLLWNQKRAAIPIGVVIDMTDGVRINLTNDQVRHLPPVELDIQE